MKGLSSAGGRIDIGYVFPLANHYIPHMVRTFLDQPGHEEIRFGFTARTQRTKKIWSFTR